MAILGLGWGKNTRDLTVPINNDNKKKTIRTSYHNNNNSNNDSDTNDDENSNKNNNDMGGIRICKGLQRRGIPVCQCVPIANNRNAQRQERQRFFRFHKERSLDAILTN